MNDYDVRVVKTRGEFTRHAHPETDELFLRLRSLADQRHQVHTFGMKYAALQRNTLKGVRSLPSHKGRLCGIVALTLSLVACGRDAGSDARILDGCDNENWPSLAMTGSHDELINVYGLTNGGRVLQVTNDGRSGTPFFSPDGNTILFARAAEGAPSLSAPPKLSSLWTVTAEVEPKLLLQTVELTDPEYSPDGFLIAFAGRLTEASESREVVIANSDGSGVRPLSSAGAQGATVDEVAWRADGTSLTFVQTLPLSDGERMTEIWTIDASSGRAQKVYEQPGVGIRHLSWSPAGDALLFGDRPIEDDPGLGRIVRELDLTTGEVTTRATQAAYPAYVGKGGDLLFLADEGEDADPGTTLTRQDADGRQTAEEVALDAVPVDDLAVAPCAQQ